MEDHELLATSLKAGKLLLYPTDTCLGLGHDVFSELGRERLYKLKKMPDQKPVSVLVGSAEMAKEYGQFNDLAWRLWERFLPGQLTLLVPRTDSLPAFFNPESSLIGIRYIDFAIVNEVIDSLGNPISTTSANRSGEPITCSVDEFLEEFDPNICDVNFMLDYNEVYEGAPSTILKVVSEDRLELVREGSLLQEINEEFGTYIN